MAKTAISSEEEDNCKIIFEVDTVWQDPKKSIKLSNKNELAIDENIEYFFHMRPLSGILFFSFLPFLFSSHLIGESLPYFSFSDQYGTQVTSNSLKGNTSIILGCEVSDIELCRKLGRKIYWKMQNLLGKDSTKIKFIPYLNMTSTNAILEKYIKESKTKEYESIFLDRRGDLKIGLKKDYAYLRIFNRQGTEIHNEYLDAVNLMKINELHEILKKNI